MRLSAAEMKQIAAAAKVARVSLEVVTAAARGNGAGLSAAAGVARASAAVLQSTIARAVRVAVWVLAVAACC